MIVGVIGVGRVGAVLGAALEAAGHEVVAASRVSPLLPRTKRLPLDEVALAARDLLLIAVPDDALPGVAAGLFGWPGTAKRSMLSARRGRAAQHYSPDQVVAHTSGAHGLAILRPTVERPLALHPAMTFTGTATDLARLAGISYGVTAPDDLRPFATRVVADLGGTPEWIAEDKRALYHAALAHGANHLVTLVNDAADRLRDAGVSQPERVLRPLVKAALDNALAMGDNALTGPVSRGDTQTIKSHVDALSDTGTLPAYLALARRTADRAIAAGRLRVTDAEALLDVLAVEARQ